MPLAELGLTTETPYIPFPTEPKLVRVGKFFVTEYISPFRMDKYIKELSDKVPLRGFEEVIVNLNGGKFLFKRMSQLQKYQKAPTLVEYHRPDGGFGANVVTPVPERLLGKKALVIDDIYDSGGTMQAILSDLSPDSQAIALVTKNGITNQIQIGNIMVGLRIDNVWIGGCGMDMGFGEEGNSFRDYPGIVVNSAS
jgi:hypoxanthine-guanine phosphoribosyltransferase